MNPIGLCINKLDKKSAAVMAPAWGPFDISNICNTTRQPIIISGPARRHIGSLSACTAASDHLHILTYKNGQLRSKAVRAAPVNVAISIIKSVYSRLCQHICQNKPPFCIRVTNFNCHALPAWQNITRAESFGQWHFQRPQSRRAN